MTKGCRGPRGDTKDLLMHTNDGVPTPATTTRSIATRNTMEKVVPNARAVQVRHVKPAPAPAPRPNDGVAIGGSDMSFMDRGRKHVQRPGDSAQGGESNPILQPPMTVEEMRPRTAAAVAASARPRNAPYQFAAATDERRLGRKTNADTHSRPAPFADTNNGVGEGECRPDPVRVHRKHIVPPSASHKTSLDHDADPRPVASRRHPPAPKGDSGGTIFSPSHTDTTKAEVLHKRPGTAPPRQTLKGILGESEHTFQPRKYTYNPPWDSGATQQKLQPAKTRAVERPAWQQGPRADPVRRPPQTQGYMRNNTGVCPFATD